MTTPELAHSLALPQRRGLDLLHDPRFNKGTAFTPSERHALGLRGLLPPGVFDEASQLDRNIQALRRKASDFERYQVLSALAERNQTLFFRLLCKHISELLPIVYTPTVGEACQRYGYFFQRTRGLFVSADDRGYVSDVLRNWPERDIRVIVVTDGSRILGLGDLGAHGMGIPVGKLTLYTVCAGVQPHQCLPITLDVGCDNDAMREDPLYVGLRRRRLRGADYDALLAEFMDAVAEVFPRALVQFEDFANNIAFDLLERYRDTTCCFNDDIQGTAAVAVAGVLASLRVTQRKLEEQKLLFVGAGEAGIGTADLFVSMLIELGVAPATARKQCWFVDSKGLVTAARKDLNHHKQRYAHESPGAVVDLLGAVELLKPTVLIGVSGQPQAIKQPVVEAMARHNERPIVFALSNPTSKAADALGAEDAHQVVFQAEVELARARVALPARTASQLVVDAPALVPLGAQHEQPAGHQRLLLEPRHLGPDLLRTRVVLARARVFDLGQFLPDAHVGIAAELDVGAAPGHVGGDRHRPGHPRLPDDVGLLLVVAGIEDGEHLGLGGAVVAGIECRKRIGVGEVVLLPALLAQHLRQLLRLLDRGRAHQHRLPALLALVDQV
jgi:malic enzyme